MKNLLIGKSLALNAAKSSKTYDGKDITTLADGAISLVNLAGGLMPTGAKVANDFAIYLGNNDESVPRSIPEVDVNSLRVVYSEYAEKEEWSFDFAIDTSKEYTIYKGDILTFTFHKHGVPFNERNNWSFSFVAPSDLILNENNVRTFEGWITDEYAKVKDTLPVEIDVHGDGCIYFTALDEESEFTVNIADDMPAMNIDGTNHAKAAVNDTAYLKNLALQCAAGRGHNYTEGDVLDLYPEFASVPDNTTFTVFTLTWNVGRKSAKTRDEVVNQVLHIALPTGAAAIATLKTMFGLS